MLFAFHSGNHFVRPGNGFAMGIFRLVPQEPFTYPSFHLPSFSIECKFVSASGTCIRNGGSYFSFSNSPFKAEQKERFSFSPDTPGE